MKFYYILSRYWHVSFFYFLLTVDGSDYFTIAMHHGGHFSSMHPMHYMQGEIDFFDLCEGDRMSLIELKTMARMLGHEHGSI